MGGTQKGPVSREEAAEERAFGDNKEQTSDCGKDVTAGIEEEELLLLAPEILRSSLYTYFRDNKSLDKHDNAAGNDRSECDDVQAAHNVEDDVAWSSQMLG